jgi:carboxymethylenebutenolidase
MTRDLSSKRGVTSYVVVAFLAAAVGAAGAFLFRQAPNLDAITTHGEWIWIQRTSDSLRAYVAYPERRDPAPAVIVIHEIFGLTDWEPTVGDKLAANGYVAIVPDMLSSKFGMTPPSPDSGRKLMAQLTPDGITTDLHTAYDYLNRQGSVRKDHIGVIGFCWGGGQTFRYATSNPNLKAAVVCYGPNPDTTTFDRIRAPILGVYGENDNRINSQLPTVSRTMSEKGKRFEADSYPGTGHGFLKPGRRGSDSDQVEKAWTKILAFFKKELQ